MQSGFDALPDAAQVGRIAPHGANLSGTAAITNAQPFEDHRQQFGKEITNCGGRCIVIELTFGDIGDLVGLW